MQKYCPLLSRHGNLVKCLGIRCEWFDEKSNACAIGSIAKLIVRDE